MLFQVTPTTQHYWKDIEIREEGGTPQIVGSIRAGLVMQLKEAVGCGRIMQIEDECVKKVHEKWRNVEEVSNTESPLLCNMNKCFL